MNLYHINNIDRPFIKFHENLLSIAKSSLQQNRFFPLVLVFSVTFAIYLASPRSSQVYSNSRWSIQLALSIIREGNVNLDEFHSIIKPYDGTVQIIQGHQYSIYPIGTPLLAVPTVFAYNLIHPIKLLLVEQVHPLLQEIIASAITALTAVLIYSIARLYLTIKQSFLVVFIFAFCTSAWSTASRALWQHGPSMLCLSLALYLLLLAREKPRLVQYASIPLAFAYVVRPLNAFSIIFISLYVLICHREHFFKYLLWSCVVAFPFFFTNYTSFGALLPPYYHSYGTFIIPTIGALVGLL